MSREVGDAEASLRGKRIVFVLAGEVLGGAERGALDLAETLRERAGAEVAICALDDRSGPARRLAEARDISWTCVRTPWVGGSVKKSTSHPGGDGRTWHSVPCPSRRRGGARRSDPPPRS